MQFKELVDSYNVDSFPHNLILIGEEGCGKHTLCNYISSCLKYELKDISDNFSLDILWEAQLNSQPIIYIIDLDYKLIKYQNELLKTLEDYSSYNYFILLSTVDKNILPTIMNRCTIWRYKKYSEDELEKIGNYKNLKLKGIFNTPGQILKWGDNNLIDELQDFCTLIFDKINIANISNVLSIVDKIGFDKKDNKYPLDLFKKVLYYVSYNKCLLNSNKIYSKIYNLTREYINSTKYKNIDQQRKLEQYLFRLKFLIKNDNF